jgi:probable F420-dependent oxidoreductase
VKHGLAIFPTDEGLPPGVLAAHAEDRGFESLWVTDHSHIPSSRSSHFDPANPKQLEREYFRLLDPLVALTAAACASSDLRIGTGVCLIPQRDHIQLAKEIATLDLISAGRFLFGIGAGWCVEEMQNHGVDPTRRFALMREKVGAMKQIWTEEEASFHGSLVSFERIQSWPKPVQRPHPPILVGGNGPNVEKRVLAYGNGWLPQPEDGLAERIRALVRRGDAEGVAPEITLFGCQPGSWREWSGTGVERCVYWLPPADAASITRAVDRIALSI